MSLILQLDYSSKNVRPIFEQFDPHKEGKISVDHFNQVFRDNTNGRGIDMWLTENQLAMIIEYLNPS